MTAASAPSRTAEETGDPRVRDARLMASVAAGDDAAFARLHREHYPAVFRLAMTTVLDREEARDVAQEVFVHAHRIAGRWQPRAMLRTWLYRTTLNVALGMRRRLGRWLRPRGVARSEIGAERKAIAEQTIDEVRVALASLSPRQRAVVGLHLEAEMSAGEIAEQLGITANAVRVTLHKGLQRLRVVLGDSSAADTAGPEDSP